MAIAPIELIHEGDVFGHGTGFVWASQSKKFLITNWHNLSGQNPFDGSYLNKGARVPDAVRFRPGAWIGPALHRYSLNISLFEQFHKPQWKQHRHFFDLNIDIAILEIEDKFDGFSYLAAINHSNEKRLFSHVGSDVFIVGYPFSDFDDVLDFPIWKRGSLASEPLIGWKRRPAFLIDAASRPGMSGSPVIRKIFGPAPIMETNRIVILGDNVMTQEFIGVYSGHLSTKNADVTLGFAWYGKLIDEIIADGTDGTRL